MQFFAREGVVAVLEPGSGRNDHGAILVQGPNQNRDPKEPPTAAQIVVASEHYNRIARLLEHNMPVTIELNVQNRFVDDTLDAFNVIAEIPGTDQGRRGRDARRALRLVACGHRRHRQRRRLGGHDGGDAHPEDDGRSDAPHGAAGAVDGRGTGAPRVARVRQAAVWRSRHDAAQAGAREAVGLLQHGQRHRRDSRRVPAGKRGGSPDVCRVDGAVPQPGDDDADDQEHGRRPIICRSTRWVCRASSSSRIRWSTAPTRTTRTWIVYDRIQAQDMMKNAVIIASFVYHAANRDTLLPRKALPTPRPPQAGRPRRHSSLRIGQRILGESGYRVIWLSGH